MNHPPPPSSANLSPWQGKSWNTLGDSITEPGRYQVLVATALGLRCFNNYGKSATEICDGKSPQSSDQALYGLPMCIRYAGMEPAADLVTVFGGTNDFGHNQPLGTPADSTCATFYGALKVMLTGIITANPAARLAIFTPLQRTFAGDAGVVGMTNALGLRLVDYVDAIREVAAVYSVPVLDLYRNAGISPENASHFLADGIHPNEAGYARIAGQIAQFLNRIA